MQKDCLCEICQISERLLPGWKAILTKEMTQKYFLDILNHLHGVDFFPKPSKILHSLSFFECPETKVVILGQDPYHGPGQATGLSFSVPVGMRLPPSLANIRKEIQSSTGRSSQCPGGSLTGWAKQGVLLLNSTLTVVQKKPRSHASLGWMQFTDEIIRSVSAEADGCVFMLWGKDAQEKEGLIDKSRHLILKTSHPSPFSARRGFLGSGHFRLANEYLVERGREPITW